MKILPGCHDVNAVLLVITGHLNVPSVVTSLNPIHTNLSAVFMKYWVGIVAKYAVSE
jgi:hypothetical protein